MEWKDIHSIHSVLRENILEHKFISDLLCHFWRRKIFDVEILKSEFDAGGYDIIISRGNLVRHVQLKSRRVNGTTRDTTISLKLQARPSACIICFEIDDNLTVANYLWYGNEPSHPIGTLDQYPVAKHNKGTSEGTKLPRPEHRKVPFSKFERFGSLEKIAEKLIG